MEKEENQIRNRKSNFPFSNSFVGFPFFHFPLFHISATESERLQGLKVERDNLREKKKLAARLLTLNRLPIIYDYYYGCRIIKAHNSISS